MRSIDTLVIHCSATPNGHSLFRLPGTRNRVTPVQIIDEWHQARSFKRGDYWRQRFNPDLGAIGYHHVIYTNGCPATGRHHAEVGAHVKGHNADTIGICLIGTDKFAADQWATLRALVQALQKQYPGIGIVGHRDLSPDADGDGKVEPREWLKTCPGFDVATWLKGGMAPLADHLQEVQ